MLSPSQAVEMFGVTANSPPLKVLNTYSAGKYLDVHAHALQGKRLDYIFFRTPAGSSCPIAQTRRV